jgi:hypothetical protein
VNGHRSSASARVTFDPHVAPLLTDWSRPTVRVSNFPEDELAGHASTVVDSLPTLGAGVYSGRRLGVLGYRDAAELRAIGEGARRAEPILAIEPLASDLSDMSYLPAADTFLGLDHCRN